MDRVAPRTVRLTERKPRECRLTDADVAFLLTEHPTHIELAPTHRRGRYRLTPAGHVGTIVAPRCRLVIRPKVPLRSLFHLLDPAELVHSGTGAADARPACEPLDFLAARLARLLGERAEAGLHRGYAERAEAGPYLHGRLDLPRQLREAGPARDRLHCQFEDFTPDVPCNQVPRATAERVLRSPLPGEAVRGALRRALQSWPEAGGISPGPEAFAAALADRPPEAYRPLLDLCRLLAEGLFPGSAGGAVACPSFLIDMDRVFERYVTAGVVDAFAESKFQVTVQPLLIANRPVAGLDDLHMRPDLLVGHDGRPLLVVDVKWKVLAGDAPAAADLYQVLAYGTALGARRAVLVYPGKRDRCWSYEMAWSDVCIDVRTVRVTGSRQACARSLQRLGRDLRAAATGHRLNPTESREPPGTTR